MPQNSNAQWQQRPMPKEFSPGARRWAQGIHDTLDEIYYKYGRLDKGDLAAGVAQEITDATGNVASVTETAESLKTRMTTAEGDISTIEQTVDGITTRVSDAEGGISTIEQTVDGIATRVSTAEGDISTIEQTAAGIATRVTNAEGDISTINQTVSGISSTVSGHTGDISTIEQTAAGIATRVTNAEGDISTLEQTATSIILAASSDKVYRAATQSALMTQLAALDPPVAMAVGLLWLDTTTMLIKRCSAVSPLTWAAVQANVVHTSYIDIQDDFIDIKSTGTINIGANAKLVLSSADRLETTAGTSLTSYVSSAANGRSKVYNTTWAARPTTGVQVGDLLIQSDSTPINKLYRWNGTGWVDARDGAATLRGTDRHAVQVDCFGRDKRGQNITLTSQLYSLMAANINLSANNSIKLAVSGGTNLIQSSQIHSDMTNWSGSYPTYYRTFTSNTQNVLISPVTGDMLQAGTYTFSFNARGNLADSGQYSRVRLSTSPDNVTYTTLKYVPITRDLYTRQSYTFKLTSPAYLQIQIYNYDSVNYNTHVYFRYPQLEKGTMATDWSPAPSDPASGVQASGVDIGPDRVRLYSTGKLLGEGAEIDFDTNLFNLHDADKEILTATSGGVAVGADHINAQKYLGPIVGTHPGGTIPWKGGLATTLNGLPKYLLNDATINVPAGTYNESLIVRGFCGAKLIINLAPGVTMTRQIDVRYCDAVTITGASNMSSSIQPLTDYQGIYVESVKQIYIQYLRVTGRARTNASNGTTHGIALNAAIGEVMDCIVERVSNAIRANRGCLIYALNNRGGVVGGSDYATLANLSNGVQALAGSHVGIYGTIPAAPTATSTFAGTITGTGTPTGSPGTAPPAPTTVVRNYAQSVAAGYVVQNTTDYQGFSTSRKPAQGVSGAFRFAGVWMLPTITNASTATVAKLTITRAASDGSTAAVTVRLMYVTATWATISGSSRTAAMVNALFTATGHEVALGRGESATIMLSASMLNLIKNGTIKGFGVAHSYTPWVKMEATIDLEVTTAS